MARTVYVQDDALHALIMGMRAKEKKDNTAAIQSWIDVLNKNVAQMEWGKVDESVRGFVNMNANVFSQQWKWHAVYPTMPEWKPAEDRLREHWMAFLNTLDETKRQQAYAYRDRDRLRPAASMSASDVEQFYLPFSKRQMPDLVVVEKAQPIVESASNADAAAAKDEQKQK